MATQSSPSLYWLNRNRKNSSRTSKSVPSGYNKSGIALTGPGGSGTATVQNTSAAWKKKPGLGVSKLRVAELSRDGKIVVSPGGSGPSVKSRWVGEGASRRYADVPEAHKEGHADAPSAPPAATQKPSERSAPRDSLAKSLAGKAPERVTQADVTTAQNKADSGGKMTLNDFMALATASGKSNAYRRGYQMWKNYKKTGKLPARRVRPD